MTNYNQYGKVAIIVAKENGNPKDNWKAEVKNAFPNSKSSQKKSCPKSAFLGLCEDGYVKGVPKGNYTKSIKNKEYAINAIKIIKNNPNKTFTPKKLWEKLNLGDKRHNSQMDVVLALWNNVCIARS